MLRPDDCVHIKASGEYGVVSEVHTDDVRVRVLTFDGSEERSYPHDRLRFIPNLRQPSSIFACKVAFGSFALSPDARTSDVHGFHDGAGRETALP